MKTMQFSSQTEIQSGFRKKCGKFSYIKIGVTSDIITKARNGNGFLLRGFNFSKFASLRFTWDNFWGNFLSITATKAVLDAND